MEAATKKKVAEIKAYAKRHNKGGYSVYSQCKRDLEILDLTSSEYDQVIRQLCLELKI